MYGWWAGCACLCLSIWKPEGSIMCLPVLLSTLFSETGCLGCFSVAVKIHPGLGNLKKNVLGAYSFKWLESMIIMARSIAEGNQA